MTPTVLSSTVARTAFKLDSNHNLCDSSAELFQLNYHANWQLALTLVHDKPVDNRYISIYNDI